MKKSWQNLQNHMEILHFRENFVQKLKFNLTILFSWTGKGKVPIGFDDLEDKFGEPGQEQVVEEGTAEQYPF